MVISSITKTAMKIKDEYKIFLLSLAGSVLLWLLDAVVDSVAFHEGFKESFFDFSGHEIYFRLFVTVGLVTFGLIINRVQKRQKAVEDRYKNIVELTTDIIYVADREGNQMFWNDAAYRILERTPEEIIGKSFLLSIHPDDREDTQEKRRQLINSKVDVLNNIENRYITKSGKVIYFSHNIRVLRDEAGNVIGTQGIGRDISERKETEQAIRTAMVWAEDERARSESILSAIGDGISIIDRDYLIQYQNAVHRDTLGGDKRGLTCYQAYARAEAVCPGCPIAETFQDGQIHVLEKTVPLNGDVRTLEIKSSPLKDASGKIVAGIEAVRDITPRKRANEKLKLYSEAIEAAMDGIQIVQLDGTVLYSNKAVEEIYGFTPEELTGRNVNEMNADHEFAVRVIIPQMREHGRWNGEVMVLHKDGTAFPIWLATSLVKDELGKPIAMIGIIRDITERKQAEEILKRHHEQLMKLVEERTSELSGANEKLRREIADRERMEQELLKAQKLESLGILAGGIAHDFNNLLASIMGNISLALLDLDPSRQRRQAARRSGTGVPASAGPDTPASHLLQRGHAGQTDHDHQRIDQGVRGVRAPGFPGEVRFSFPDDLWLVDVDEGQISQVINNLVINADHAMPEGGHHHDQL